MKKFISIISQPWPAGLFILGLGILTTSTRLNPGAGFFNSYLPGVFCLLVSTFLLIVAHAKDHAEQINQGQKINHYAANFWRALFTVPFISLIHVFEFNLLKELILLGIGVCYFVPVFNYSLNKFRDLEPFYIGHGRGAAWLDSLFYSIFGRFGGLALSVLCVGLGVFLSWVYA